MPDPIQTELKLKPRKQRGGPVVESNDDRIGKMIAWLQGRGWVKRREVAAGLAMNDRVMRAVKAASGGRVISTTTLGYCLASEANLTDFREALDQCRSRAKKNYQALLEMRRVYHQIGSFSDNS